MLFTSFEYIVFLLLIFLIYHLVSQTGRWIVLLLASLAFYACMTVPYLLAVFGGVTSATYLFGLLLAKVQLARQRKTVLWCGISANLAVLVGMKYLPFLTENINAVLGGIGLSTSLPHQDALAAIGVSYFIFQAISYLIDIYLEIEVPEHHLGYFAVYMGFFPKLLQGPIERAGDLLPQLKRASSFNYDNARAGLLLFAWGAFQKVVVANNLELFANYVYDNPQEHSGLVLIIGTYFYAFQLYYDFAGYTNMALGSALLFNINLTQNFNSPYLASSVSDFWRRWHITFSRWILDYIFKPLQMSWRNWQTWGTPLALMVTFLVSGIWHGASWGFVIWGGLHGVFLASSVFYKPWEKRISKRFNLKKSQGYKIWNTVVTFNMVCFAWIFFRANNFFDMWHIVTHLLSGIQGCRWIFLSQGDGGLFKLVLSVLILFVVGWLKTKKLGMDVIFERPVWIRWGVYNALALTIFLFGTFAGAGFVYFQF